MVLTVDVTLVEPVFETDVEPVFETVLVALRETDVVPVVDAEDEADKVAVLDRDTELVTLSTTDASPGPKVQELYRHAAKSEQILAKQK